MAGEDQLTERKIAIVQAQLNKRTRKAPSRLAQNLSVCDFIEKDLIKDYMFFLQHLVDKLE